LPEFPWPKDIARGAGLKPDRSILILGRRDFPILFFTMAAISLQQAMKLAEQLKSQGNLAEAEKIYRQILAAAPANAGALNLLGTVVGDLNRLTEARDLFRQAAQAEPTYQDAWTNLSLCCERLDDFDGAIATRRKAIELNPDWAEHWHRLGTCLGKQGDLKEAIVALRKSHEMDPASDGIIQDLVMALCKDNQHQAAEELAFPPAPAKPVADISLRYLADSLKKAGQFDHATEIWRRTLEIDPSRSEARGQWAMCLITLGDYERGWREYESRWDCDTFGHTLRLDPRRQWGASPTGHPDVAGKTILLYSEQGMGDTIQFIRYASIFADRGARVIAVCVWPLKSLLENCAGIRLVYRDGEPLPNYDWHVPLMSLPMAFGTTPQTIPANIPYLRADAGRCKSWQSRAQSAATPGSRLRVGLAWAGNPQHKNDSNRSIDPALLSGLASVEGIDFFSLQKSKENKRAEPPPGLKLIDLTTQLHDFAETAALIEQLDLVISADTAVAHLAGAMGKPVWTLIPNPPDFRWHIQGEQTAWYPTMRLFRQESHGKWSDVIEKIVRELKIRADTPRL
jgi:tetratricopeptide (TPR) repeat protein